MMARPRKSTKDALEEKIEKAEAEVVSAKEKYEKANEHLKELLDKRDELRKEELFETIKKSNRSYEELMSFLNGKAEE